MNPLDWFLYPWLLPAVALAAIVWWDWHRPGRRAAIRYAGVSRLAGAGRLRASRFRIILPILRSLAIVLLVIAVARPRKADEQTRVQTEGVAIQLVVDRSGSMGEQDFVTERGDAERRIDAVKRVVRSFVEGDGKDHPGRPDDLVGLIAFGTYADTECPLTHDHEHVLRALKEIEPHRTREEGQTAIGDALLLAVERIRTIGRRQQEDDAFKVKSRVIILLTDGEQTAGKYRPEEAAEVAAALGVKVYTIGAAPEFRVEQVGGLIFPSRQVKVPVQVDEKSLNRVAELTGGRYFRAKDASSLEAIYAEIDRLERSAIDETRYYVYEELAYNWIELGQWRLPPPLLVALILLSAEVALGNTRFRKAP